MSLEAAREADARRDWTAARELYAQALDTEESADALEGLGRALWWLGDPGPAIELCERAVERYAAGGRHAEAADLAVFLAGEYRIAGNPTLGNGWLERARRFLEDCEDCPARSWLHIELAKRATEVDDAEREAQAALVAAQRRYTASAIRSPSGAGRHPRNR